MRKLLKTQRIKATKSSHKLHVCRICGARRHFCRLLCAALDTFGDHRELVNRCGSLLRSLADGLAISVLGTRTHNEKSPLAGPGKRNTDHSARSRGEAQVLAG